MGARVVEGYAALDHDRRLAALAELQRARAELDAREQRLLAAIAADPPVAFRVADPGLDKQWVREEIACVLHVAPVTAADRIAIACELVEKLPATLAALERGQLSLLHARRLAEATISLDPATSAAVEARVLPRAAGQTVGQFGAALRRAVLAVAPREQDELVRDAVAERRVCISPQDNGTSELWALLPAAQAAALEDALAQRADQFKAINDGRTAEQRRADALVDLALGGQPLRPQVSVTVALSTLLGTDEQPGELDRHGPIPAALARALAFDPTSTWRRLLTDPAGQLLDVSASSYRPPAAMARLVTTRDATCRFPGCRRRAARCELDHLHPYQAGGATTPQNLHPLCPRHHHLKHETGWQVQRLPDGTTRWRTAAGRTYDQPPDEHLPRDTTTDPPPATAAA